MIHARSSSSGSLFTKCWLDADGSAGAARKVSSASTAVLSTYYESIFITKPFSILRKHYEIIFAHPHFRAMVVKFFGCIWIIVQQDLRLIYLGCQSIICSGHAILSIEVYHKNWGFYYCYWLNDFHFFLKNLTSLCVAVLIVKIFMTLISEIMISLLPPCSNDNTFSFF